jgi:hypothetical protein
VFVGCQFHQSNNVSKQKMRLALILGSLAIACSIIMTSVTRGMTDAVAGSAAANATTIDDPLLQPHIDRIVHDFDMRLEQGILPFAIPLTYRRPGEGRAWFYQPTDIEHAPARAVQAALHLIEARGYLVSQTWKVHGDVHSIYSYLIVQAL